MNRNLNHDKKFFYGWFIVVSGFFLMGATMGIVYNCSSFFIKPVCEDLGFSRQGFGVVQTLIMGVYVLCSLVAGKVYEKVNLLNLMRVSSVIMALAFFTYAWATELWMFYLITIIVSLGYFNISTVPLSLILNNWFEKKRGFAIGLAFTGSGVASMLCSPLIAWLMQYGWQFTYQVLAVILFFMSVPFTFFVVKIFPKDKGLSAYGAEQTMDIHAEQPVIGPGFAHVRRRPEFWIFCLCGTLLGMGMTTVVQLTAPHLSDVGYTDEFAARIVAISMAVLAAGKFFLGVLFDRLSTDKCVALSICCTLCGILGLAFAQVEFALIGIFIGCSLGVAYGSVAHSIVARNVFGTRDYASILGFIAAFFSLGSAIIPTINGAVYDIAGSYLPSLLGIAVILTAVGILYIFLIRKLSREYAAPQEYGSEIAKGLEVG